VSRNCPNCDHSEAAHGDGVGCLRATNGGPFCRCPMEFPEKQAVPFLVMNCAFCYHPVNMHEGPDNVEKSCTSCYCEVFVMPVFRHQPPEVRAADAENESARDDQVGGEHYRKFKIQPWDVVDEYDLGFYAGNALKYLLRAGHKNDALEDLRKCRHYLDKLIERAEADDV
jgi:hypothetical protein